jgi:hypothetical protein
VPLSTAEHDERAAVTAHLEVPDALLTLGEVERELVDFDPLRGTIVDRTAGQFVTRDVDVAFLV